MVHRSTHRNSQSEVGGRAEAGFGPVVDQFRKTVAADGQSGAALSIWVDGRQVVDVWAGMADGRDGTGWTDSTISMVYSCTKGLASLAVGMLVESGRIPSLEMPLAELWPEFGQHGKDSVTLGDALAHRAGISAPRRDITIEEFLDGSTLAAALAGQEPLWEPGRDHSYHAITHGVITEEVVARVAGHSIGAFIADRMSAPLNADAWLGLPAELAPRLTRLVNVDVPPDGDPTVAFVADPDALYWHERATTLGGGIDLDLTRLNDPTILRHEFAGAGGVASATGLARIWSAAVTETAGVRLVNEDTLATLGERRSAGPGRFPTGPAPYQSWGAGVMVPSDWQPYLTPRSVGHDGAGGQVAFADPDAKVGFAFVTNLMGDFERGQSIVRALGHVLGV